MNVTRRQALIAASLGGALVTAVKPTSVQADQPAMEAALIALRSAQTQLAQASSDKGGHRANAMKLIKQAIAEVQKGIEYDRKH